MSDAVKTVRRGKVLEITLDRPPANAFDDATMREMYETFCMFRDDPELVVALVTGAGERIFSAGWDLKAVASGDEPDMVENPEPALFLPEMFDLNKPLVAAINGYAVGGGFELALGCDLMIAADNAQFFLPEMERGFLPDGGVIQMLFRRIPYYVYMDMLLTGARMSAQDAMKWGLVREVVPLAELMPRAREVVDLIAEGAPLALQALKEVTRAFEPLSVEDSFAMTRAAWKGGTELEFYEKTMRSEDFKEGVAAFAEKRKPVFKGR